MKRLITPVVYILGFSVFSACTSTKMTPIKEMRLSEDPKEMVMTLTDGSTLEVLGAILDPDHVSGEITTEDYQRLDQYVHKWRSKPSKTSAATRTVIAYRVEIPHGDVEAVRETRTNLIGSAAIAVLSVIGIGLVAFLVSCEGYACPR